MKLADLRPFDVINHLRDEEDVMGYLQAVMEENHPKATAAALHDVARARRQLHLTTPFDPAGRLGRRLTQTTPPSAGFFVPATTI